jgi:hypothetical protein
MVPGLWISCCQEASLSAEAMGHFLLPRPTQEQLSFSDCDCQKRRTANGTGQYVWNFNHIGVHGDIMNSLGPSLTKVLKNISMISVCTTQGRITNHDSSFVVVFLIF